MTTADFIAKTYNTTSTRERQCSSVYTDSKGTVYSYGRHYPLAIRVGNLDIINTRGYSSTTSKHIAWAWRAIGYHATPVELTREESSIVASPYETVAKKLEVIIKSLINQRDTIKTEMSTKKRKDTSVYASLEMQLAKVETHLHKARLALVEEL